MSPKRQYLISERRIQRLLYLLTMIAMLLCLPSCGESGSTADDLFPKESQDSEQSAIMSADPEVPVQKPAYHVTFELLDAVSVGQTTSTQVNPLDIDSNEKLYFLTDYGLTLINVNLDGSHAEIIELNSDPNTLATWCRYNPALEQLLIWTIPGTSPADTELQFYLTAYRLDGTILWQREMDTYFPAIPYGENWAYIQDSTLLFTDEDWNTIKKIFLPEGHFFPSRLTEDHIYLSEKAESDIPIWYAVTMDWSGTILSKELSETIPVESHILNVQDDGNSYFAFGDDSGTLNIYFQTPDGINKAVKTVQVKDGASLTVTACTAAKDRYCIFVRIEHTETSADEKPTVTYSMIQLDKEFNFINETSIPIEGEKKVVAAQYEEGSFTLFVTRRESEPFFLIFERLIAEPVLEIYKMIINEA